MHKIVFDELRKIVYENSGISLSDKKATLVSSRINKRLRFLRLTSYEDYLEFLKTDVTGDELVHFLDVISTNTTKFYREAVHFEILASLMEQWIGQKQRRFRIWCAAASSGEEPYTLAMTILESVKGARVDVKILATDISSKVLAKAQTGVYRPEAVAEIPKHLLLGYFTKIREGEDYHFQAGNKLKNLITYKRLNLAEPPFPMKGPLDVVFCRNVMIYFDNAVRKRLIDNTFSLLKPGGYLMTGHSESLASIRAKFKSVLELLGKINDNPNWNNILNFMASLLYDSLSCFDTCFKPL